MPVMSDDPPGFGRYSVAMIRRDEHDHFLLISQQDHAQLAGLLAERIGNGLFEPPVLARGVMEAALFHDSGWQIFDESPTLNPDGFPSHIFETDIRIAIEAWTGCVEQAFTTDRYASLLISLHVMSLAARAADRISSPVDEAGRDRAFRLQQFIHRQIELQELFRNDLQMRVDLPLRGGLADPGRSPEEDLLRSNFFLMQFVDQLSLTFCFDRLIFEKIHPLLHRPGDWPQEFRLARETEGVFRLDPWPFDRERIALEIPARRILKQSYSDNLAIRRAMEAGETLQIGVTLKTWHSS